MVRGDNQKHNILCLIKPTTYCILWSVKNGEISKGLTHRKSCFILLCASF